MKIEVFVPVTLGQSATCRVYGNNEAGYVMVKVNGTRRTVLPDENPGVPNDRRMVFGPLPGRGYDVWTDPQWAKGDSVEFELFEANGKPAGSQATTVL
jgi:hypothetical protein